MLTGCSQWIKTDLGGQAADLEIEQAIPKVMELVLRQNKEDNGRFLDILLPGFEPKYNRRIVPW